MISYNTFNDFCIYADECIQNYDDIEQAYEIYLETGAQELMLNVSDVEVNDTLRIAFRCIAYGMASVIDFSDLTKSVFSAKYNIPYRTVLDWSSGSHEAPRYATVALAYIVLTAKYF